MAGENKQQGAFQHKCPNCGAALKYDPLTGSLSCEHCGSYTNFEKSNKVVERDFSELVTFQQWKDSDVATYACKNCGAVSVAARTTLSTHCPYCNSPVVLDDKTGSLVKPDTIVPFELTAKQAAEKLSVWRRKKLYAPRKFRKETKEDCVKGVYVPAWTFDAETTTDYEGTVGYHRTRTVRRNGKTYTETYTEWRRISGTIDASFDDIFIRANDNVSEKDFRKLQPFAQSKYMVYDDEYLAGYLADHYTLEPTGAFVRAQNIMREQIRSQILSRYNADEEGPINLKMEVNSKSFKYVMVPVYVAATRYNKKLYNQYVSGVYYDNQKQQCKICGKAPTSGLKVFFTVLAGIAAVVGLVLLAIHLSNDPGWEFGLNQASEIFGLLK